MATIAVTLDSSSVIPIWWRTGSDFKDDYTLISPGETKNVTHPWGTFGYVFDGRGERHDDVYIGSIFGKEPCTQTQALQSPLYEGTIECDLCDTNTVKVTVVSAPQPNIGALHIATAPQGATVTVDGNEVGSTDMVYKHTMPPGETKDRVSVKLSLEHFKDKLFHKTLRSALSDYAFYRLSPAHKIKGKTKKDRAAGSVKFTFTIFTRGRGGTQVFEANVNLSLINQTTGLSKALSTHWDGVAQIELSYDDAFFANGKNHLVCVMDNTADRIRIFKTITIKK